MSLPSSKNSLHSLGFCDIIKCVCQLLKTDERYKMANLTMVMGEEEMLSKISIFLVKFLCVVGMVTLTGCYVENTGSTRDADDIEPPAVPRGLKTITGDEYIYIEWYRNGEHDLSGYSIWRSEDAKNFELLAELSAGTTHYIDEDVRNGETYYYAISAYDFDGNQSELSPENVWDTPRPEGQDIRLEAYDLYPDESGFDFSHPHKGAIPWDSRATDVYFGIGTVNDDITVFYLYSDNETFMQDMGYHETFTAVDVAPEDGYIDSFIELIEGHIYAINTPDDNFAKIHILEVSDDAVIFDWAYQTESANIQLAPALPR